MSSVRLAPFSRRFVIFSSDVLCVAALPIAGVSAGLLAPAANKFYSTLVGPLLQMTALLGVVQRLQGGLVPLPPPLPRPSFFHVQHCLALRLGPNGEWHALNIPGESRFKTRLLRGSKRELNWTPNKQNGIQKNFNLVQVFSLGHILSCTPSRGDARSRALTAAVYERLL